MATYRNPWQLPRHFKRNWVRPLRKGERRQVHMMLAEGKEPLPILHGHHHAEWHYF